MPFVSKGLTTLSAAVVCSAAATSALLCRRHSKAKVPQDTKYYLTTYEHPEGPPPAGDPAKGPPSSTEGHDWAPKGLFQGAPSNAFKGGPKAFFEGAPGIFGGGLPPGVHKRGPPYLPPSREEMITKMKQEQFDVLVIGGGSAGVGVLFDASTRGLKCCLIEANDFAAGTSSKSTKLIHGGIRYLQKAFEDFDWGQLSLVCEALEERAHLLRAAPHIAQPLAILMPLYSLWKIPYCWFGVKAYGLLAQLVCCGQTEVPPTSYLSARTSSFAFPLLPAAGLKGSLLYFDGQMNDSRLCLSLALSPTVPGFVDGMQPAAAANHLAARQLIKDENGQIIGARVQDTETNEEFTIHSKVVVNCTGPLADRVRKMDHEDAQRLLTPAAGAHIVLPHWYTHKTPFGLLLPETSDGRVLFLLPWEGRTVAGTTDAPALEAADPRPKESDIDFLVKELSAYLKVDPVQMRNDIQSVWCGHRPLVSQSAAAQDTAGLVRSHTVLVDEESGLISLLGGKWTTYRRMAQDTVDKILEVHGDKVAATTPCRTKGMKIQGAVDPRGRLSPEDCRLSTGKLEHELSQSHPCLSFEQRAHLISHYGFIARDVLDIARNEALMDRLVEELPYLKAEVVFACRYEQARSVSDIIARRLPVLFLDQKLAVRVIDTVSNLMAKELGWSASVAAKKKEEALAYAETFTVSP